MAWAPITTANLGSWKPTQVQRQRRNPWARRPRPAAYPWPQAVVVATPFFLQSPVRLRRFAWTPRRAKIAPAAPSIAVVASPQTKMLMMMGMGS